MAKLVDTLVRKVFLSGRNNLVSLRDPFQVIQNLLENTKVNVMIDAGASNGRISKTLLRLVPEAEIYAFEPNPGYRRELEDYGREEKRFHPRFYALSDQEGEFELQVTESAGNTSLFSPGERLKDLQPEGAMISRMEKVRTVTLDDWARQEGISGIEVMKFDIQGAELMALEGAERILAESTLLIYTEVLFNPLYEGGAVFSQIDLFLRTHGFVLYDIYKPKYDSRGLLLWANAIFVHARRLGR